jgi:hypothetical protein
MKSDQNISQSSTHKVETGAVVRRLQQSVGAGPDGSVREEMLKRSVARGSRTVDDVPGDGGREGRGGGDIPCSSRRRWQSSITKELPSELVLHRVASQTGGSVPTWRLEEAATSQVMMELDGEGGGTGTSKVKENRSSVRTQCRSFYYT